MDRAMATRFWAKVDKTSECWEWTAATSATGYGRFQARRGKLVNAHRLSYESEHGPVAVGKELDHLCRNRVCVRPEHLEPVTHYENLMRGNGRAAVRARQTHCVRGHELSGDNLYVRRNGNRQCRTCERVRNAARKKAHRG